MTADKTTQRDSDSTRTDQIGKVFFVVGQDLRKCLICEGAFTRQAAAEHVRTLCHSQERISNGLALPRVLVAAKS